MAPRKRTGKSRGLEPNVYPTEKNGRTYYRYKRPDTGQFRGLGTDRAIANRIARQLNAALTPEESVAEQRVQQILGEQPDALPIEELARRFKAHLREVTDSKGRRRSEKTLYEYDRMVDAAGAAWPGRDALGLTRKDITDHLAQFTGRSYTAHRTVLRQMFAYLVATTDRDDNPVDGTLNKPHVVKRARLTKAEYDAIYEKAPPWFRNAMDLSLLTLQSRAEIGRMRFSDEREPGFLFVDRAKVARHEAGHIRIRIGPQLRAVLSRCRDDVASPFMVHRKPEKRRRDHLNSKEHWTQVSLRMISRTFHDLRDEAGVRADLPDEERPTFHEIRSLGGRILEEAGWTEEQVQRLYGHTTGEMTKKYLDRRGREVRYVDAETG